jgi:hypothetical protein
MGVQDIHPMHGRRQFSFQSLSAKPTSRESPLENTGSGEEGGDSRFFTGAGDTEQQNVRELFKTIHMRPHNVYRSPIVWVQYPGNNPDPHALRGEEQGSPLNSPFFSALRMAL